MPTDVRDKQPCEVRANAVDGTAATKSFYDRHGWTERDGKTLDAVLFGTREDGPIRQALYRVHVQRVRQALLSAGKKLNLLECGCGGNPAIHLLDLCRAYTGVDFSTTGLEMAAAKLRDAALAVSLQEADLCALPFGDNTFDAAYCAHVMYHITEPAAQEKAFREILRVIRPGGVAVFLVANSRPLLFPVRLARRLVADTPVLSAIANRLRPKPPLPYRPMPLTWMRGRLTKLGSVSVQTAGLPSKWFNQRVTEHRGVGGLVWKVISWIDRHHPILSAYLGNYLQITVRKGER